MITQPYPSFIDPEVGGRAKPVSNGTIFIGQNQKDAIQFPEKVYYTDSEGTEIEMDQPIYLNSAGVTVASKNSSDVVSPYTKSASYSILIRNSGGNDRYVNDSVSGSATNEWVESGEAKITAEGSTESRSMKERFADSINVKDFGAVGDGVTDDTDAITAALNSQHDVIVFTEGTYILRSKDPLKPICHVTTSKSLTLIGEGAVLKIADDSLEYQFMIGSDDPSLVVPYFEMHGFRFDCNKSMLTYTIENKALKYFNGGVKFRAAKEVYIHNNVVDDAVSRQFFFFPSVTSSGGSDSYLMDRAIVRNNTFNRVGRSDLPYYDSSLIYLNGLYGDASNNFGSGESMGVEGAVSFIEMHCATNRVSGNFCDNFMNFCIMTGITINTTIDSIVSNNVCDVYRAGIIILAGQYLDHISGLGIDGLVVVGNHVRIKQSALTSRYTFNVIGIGGGNSANLDIKNVKVQNNTVEFEKESTDLGYTSYIHGIGFPETNDATVYESIVISGNTIINAPHAGVVMGVGGGVFQNTHIGTNFITNAAQSLWPGSGSSLKSGVYVGAHELKEYFLIDKQQITDTFNTSRLKYGVNFNVSVDSKTCNVTAKANLSLSGVDFTEFSQVFRATNSNVLPYVSGQCNQDFSYGSQPLKKGSSIVHTGTGLTHELPEDGIIFLQVGWGTAAPLVGKFNQGSRIMNTSPNVDGNGNTLLGWVCIGVGSPGTWSPMIVSSTSS